MEDLTELTIAEAMSLVRRRRVAPQELVEALVDRIDAYDSVYQAYAARPTRETLLAQLAATPRSAMLRGIGLAPKDNCYTADLLTEAGSLVYQGFQPDYDGSAVALLREAGGLVLGKAQMGNLAGGRATIYGTTIPTTRNAWTPDDVRYSPAGSSSGTGTAVAARLAFAGIGTQTGGSITGPGTAQGLTAVKATFGRVSLHGVVPLTYTRDHVGPLARDALDAAIMLQILAQPDLNDPRTLGLPSPGNYTRAATVTGGRKPRLRWPTRIGVWPGYVSTSNARVNELRAVMLGELDALGATIVPEVTLPDDWDVLTGDPLGGSIADPTGPFVEFLRRDVRDFADRLPRFLNGILQSGDTTIKVQQARYLLLQRILTQLFNQCDVVLTTGSGAFDGTGLPLICFPIGFDTDITTGYQVPRGALLAGPPFAEERLLSIAAAYQAITNFHLVRPPDPSGTPADRTAASRGFDGHRGRHHPTLRRPRRRGSVRTAERPGTHPAPSQAAIASADPGARTCQRGWRCGVGVLR